MARTLPPAPVPGPPDHAGSGALGGPPAIVASQPPARRPLAPSSGGRPTRGGRHPWSWLHSLRVRLTLVYVAVLVLVLLLLAVVLNLVVGQVLYAEEFLNFTRESRVAVAREVPRFNALVSGHVVTVQGQPTDCGGAISYQQAFTETLVTPLATRADIQQVYLVNALGTVLAPIDDPHVAAGQAAPYLDANRVAALLQSAGARKASLMGILAEANYHLSASGQPLGIELLAVRYPTAAPCLGSNDASVGMVEIVTNFASTQSVLARLRFVLILLVIGAGVGGVLIGGLLTARALRPLTRMTLAARRISSGDLSQRVRLPRTDDEIGELAHSFDDMVDRIEAAFGAQAASEARMRQFVADASHELRTPLTAIRGYTDVLLRGAAGNDPLTAEKVLLATRREAERMSRLVNDLLTLARLDAGRPLDCQPVDLIALTGEAVDQARILAGQREVSLSTDGGGRLLIAADADRLKQVLLILLDNALKYGRPEPEGWVRVRVSRTERGAVLTIADNGQGIGPEDLSYIFDRFYRGERAARQRRMTGQQVAARPAEPPVPYAGDGAGARRTDPGARPTGSGLGLSIAQSIVRAHGGTIAAESRQGVGTTFTIALPRTATRPTDT
ncbi:MAG TPA: HAMP domain-containing sensor histidine kinase [Ktedonobacterales bacterium]|nr:HAMP domain-containing sensor histidine kinase [Ktedonobacterales bacterium]